MSGAYYNEIDPYAAEWLRNLIKAGHIAAGDVDTRSIEDVRPDDLGSYTQCHFFAGIGVWSYALRLAGWPDTRRVWSGSCPCQPFSVAGAGAGVRDERHLWPHWFWLIEQCRPPSIFGEQVEAAIKHGWLDLVQSDLEGIGYAVAPVGIPAAGVGAPHIRQRLWFVAEPAAPGLGAIRRRGLTGEENAGPYLNEHHEGDRFLEHASCGTLRRNPRGRAVLGLEDTGSVGDDDDEGLPGAQRSPLEGSRGWEEGRATGEPSSSPWADVEWLHCRDGKTRPAKPGIFPLAHGAPARVGRLRAYGNAIVPQVAAEVIRAYMECRP